MNRRALLLSAATIGLFGSSAVWARRFVDVVNLETPIPASLHLDKDLIKLAIVRGATAKNWEVIEEKPGVITVKLPYKLYVSVCDITYDETKYAISLNPLTSLRTTVDKVHPRYNKWVRTLDKQIYNEMLKLSK